MFFSECTGEKCVHYTVSRKFDSNQKKKQFLYFTGEFSPLSFLKRYRFFFFFLLPHFTKLHRQIVRITFSSAWHFWLADTVYVYLFFRTRIHDRVLGILRICIREHDSIESILFYFIPFCSIKKLININVQIFIALSQHSIERTLKLPSVAHNLNTSNRF